MEILTSYMEKEGISKEAVIAMGFAPSIASMLRNPTDATLDSIRSEMASGQRMDLKEDTPYIRTCHQMGVMAARGEIDLSALGTPEYMANLKQLFLKTLDEATPPEAAASSS